MVVNISLLLAYAVSGQTASHPLCQGLDSQKKMYEMGLLNTYTTASFEHLLMTSAVPYTILKLLPPIKIHGCLDSPIRYIFYARLIHH